MQKQSDAELKAAEEKEKELQKQIKELGKKRLSLKEQFEKTMKDLDNERNIANETIAAERDRQRQLLEQYEAEHSKYEVTEHKRCPGSRTSCNKSNCKSLEGRIDELQKILNNKSKQSKQELNDAAKENEAPASAIVNGKIKLK